MEGNSYSKFSNNTMSSIHSDFAPTDPAQQAALYSPARGTSIVRYRSEKSFMVRVEWRDPNDTESEQPTRQLAAQLTSHVHGYAIKFLPVPGCYTVDSGVLYYTVKIVKTASGVSVPLRIPMLAEDAAVIVTYDIADHYNKVLLMDLRMRLSE